MAKARILALILAMVLTTSFLAGCTQIWDGVKNAADPDPVVPPVQAAPLPKPEPEPEPEPIKLVPYTGPIYHVFTHSLIAFPEVAYSPTGGKGSLDRDCITVSEFNRTLEELYKNNYVLIDIRPLYEVSEENGQSVVKDKPVMLPEGNKPLVMSIDDMVYDPKKMGKGMVDKIILDDKGKLATYTRLPNGNELIAYDNEVIPILESFVQEHPDFSFQGARATLALTGWVGILGYRIDADSPNRESEIAAVKPVIEKLKKQGWSFASHGYGHYNANKLTAARFEPECSKLNTELEREVGPTDC